MDVWNVTAEPKISVIDDIPRYVPIRVIVGASPHSGQVGLRL